MNAVLTDNSFQGTDSLFLSVSNDKTDKKTIDTTNANFVKMHESYSTSTSRFRNDTQSTDVMVDGESNAIVSAETFTKYSAEQKKDKKQ